MKTFTLLRIFLGVGLMLLASVPAAAQATRTWVSGVGDDANPCSRTAPCKTFQGAISKTAAGGAINALDPGGFGAVTITKAMTIAQEGTGEAGILVAGTNGITVNAGPNDIVVLRGLDIDGGPTGSSSLNGVRFLAGGTLMIQNSSIRNFTGFDPNGFGVLFTPSGASSLFVSDTVIASNGAAAQATGGGMLIQPTGVGSAKANFVRVNVVNNVRGLRFDTAGTAGGISASVADSNVSGNSSAGLTAFTPPSGAGIKISVRNSLFSNNGTGVKCNGAGVVMRLGFSTVTGNAIGDAIDNNCTMTSMGNNMVTDNLTPGPAIPVVGAQ